MFSVVGFPMPDIDERAKLAAVWTALAIMALGLLVLYLALT